MATKKQRKKKQKARLETLHTKKYREIKAEQREKNDREAELEGVCRAALKFVDERQDALQSLRDDAKDLAKDLSVLSTRMKNLSRFADDTLTAFHEDPPRELATEALIAERDEALARISELEDALRETQERLRERVLHDHKRDESPPKWLLREAREFLDRNEVPKGFDFYEKIGRRVVRWAGDFLKGNGDAVPEDQAGD
jgi:hypothetical protein